MAEISEKMTERTEPVSVQSEVDVRSPAKVQLVHLRENRDETIGGILHIRANANERHELCRSSATAIKPSESIKGINVLFRVHIHRLRFGPLRGRDGGGNDGWIRSLVLRGDGPSNNPCEQA
ncbi:hypothetical protein CDD80_7099 [Ophiocordyceps camponoti-rufipedis]|uniref:Uncharacterized protein n=1 Tax=Ophiocordyceps camponoti-rufipedis TaxID=2004952 RepID=A0A2C5ZGG4_9HYPO|nr:hypothetical protein CDD80_7099 [Ophiocordyceps camponoti-rufipedis]